MATKQIRLTVNLFFNVPEEYEVTDLETVETLGAVTLHDEKNRVIATGVRSHESIETVDLSETEDY